MPKKETAAPAKKSTASKAKKETDNLPVPVKNTEVAVASEMDNLLAQNANTGFEGMDANDLAIPFLSIVQSNSPQRKKNHEKFIQDAEEGDIFNTVDAYLFGPPVSVIPCGYKKCFIEWRPRESGGGFVAMYDRMHKIVSDNPPNERGQRILKNGNVLTETANYYVLVETDENKWSPAVISMSSTQLKKSRRWNTMMMNRQLVVKGKTIKPPMFSFKYHLTTVQESNDRGDWFGWNIESGEQVTDSELFLMAKNLHDAVSAGAVKADFSKVDEEVQAEHEDDDSAF